MDMTHCPHCNARLVQPTTPPGCQCDPMEWRDPENVPPVCRNFDPDPCGGNCRNCEHDEECHLSANAPSSAAANTAPEIGERAPDLLQMRNLLGSPLRSELLD